MRVLLLLLTKKCTSKFDHNINSLSLTLFHNLGPCFLLAPLLNRLTTSTLIIERRHWVFDLDGTLTVPAHNFDAIREELGLEPDKPIIKTLSSMPPEKANPLRKRLESIEIELAYKAFPASGVSELMTCLQKMDYRLGIVTLNTRENAWRTLETLGIGNYFENSFVMGRSCAEPKPSPEGVLRMMEQWQTNPGDILVVGDYLYDLQMGRSAGAATVHVDSEARFSWPEMADLQCTSLSELHQQLKRLPKGYPKTISTTARN